MEKQSSDHRLLILITEPEVVKFKKSFCFDQRWLQWGDIDEVVDRDWKRDQEGTTMYKVCSRIKTCRVDLLKWSKGVITNSRKQITDLKLEMEEMSRWGGDWHWQHWYHLKRRLHEAYRNEKVYWSQKSRIMWLKEGDNNTKYFHAYVAQRRKSNSIERLLNENGAVCESEEDLEEEIQHYYNNLFTSSSPHGWQEMLQGMPRSITSALNQLLTKPVEDTEIKRALFAMNPQKAPGPDGMSLIFSNILAYCAT